MLKGFPLGAIAHIAIAGVVAGVACIALALYLKQRKSWSTESLRYNVLREFGIALIVSAAVVFTVDLSVSNHLSQQQEVFIERLNRATLPLELRAVVGPDLADELRRQVLTEPVRYSDFVVSGRLDLMRPQPPDSAYVQGDLTTTVKIENSLDGATSYRFNQKLSDVRPNRMVGFKHLRLRRLDTDGHALGPPLIDRRDERALASLVRRPTTTEIVLDTTVMLAPRSKYELSVRKVFTEDPDGYYNQRTRYPCTGMKLDVAFSPNLDVDCDFGYPDRDGRRTETHKDDSRVVAEVRSTLLPYQGIFLVWRSRPRP